MLRFRKPVLISIARPSRRQIRDPFAYIARPACSWIARSTTRFATLPAEDFPTSITLGRSSKPAAAPLVSLDGLAILDIMKALLHVSCLTYSIVCASASQNVAAEPLWSKVDSANPAFVLSFSPSGKYIAAGSSGADYPGNGGPRPLITIFEAATGAIVARISVPIAFTVPGFEARPAFIFQKENMLLCWNGSDRPESFSSYSLPDGQAAQDMVLPFDAHGLTALFSESGTLVAFTPGLNGDVHIRGVSIWCLATQKLLHQFTHDDWDYPHGDPVISRDERYFSNYEPGIGIPPSSYNSSYWSLESFDPTIIPGFSDGTEIGPSPDPRFSPNNRYFLFVGRRSYIYDLLSASEFLSVYGSFTPDSKRIVAVSSGGDFIFVPIKPDASVELSITGLDLDLSSAFRLTTTISPAGDSIAYAKSDGTIAVIKNPFAAVRFDSIAVTDEGMQLEWEGGSGRYDLESTSHLPTLPTAAWETILADTHETSYKAPFSSAARFFRLQYLPPQ
jgi:hypothetical protein